MSIDTPAAVKWLRKGAQPSERVKKLLEIDGTWESFTSGTSVEDLEKAVEAAKAAELAAAEASKVETAGAPA